MQISDTLLYEGVTSRVLSEAEKLENQSETGPVTSGFVAYSKEKCETG